MNYRPTEADAHQSFSRRRKFGSRRGKIERNLFGKVECIWCGKTDDLTIHHIHPLSKGGKNDTENRVLLCEAHHQKIHRAPAKFHKKWRKKASAYFSASTATATTANTSSETLTP